MCVSGGTRPSVRGARGLQGRRGAGRGAGQPESAKSWISHAKLWVSRGNHCNSSSLIFREPCDGGVRGLGAAGFGRRNRRLTGWGKRPRVPADEGARRDEPEADQRVSRGDRPAADGVGQDDRGGGAGGVQGSAEGLGERRGAGLRRRAGGRHRLRDAGETGRDGAARAAGAAGPLGGQGQRRRPRGRDREEIPEGIPEGQHPVRGQRDGGALAERARGAALRDDRRGRAGPARDAVLRLGAAGDRGVPRGGGAVPDRPAERAGGAAGADRRGLCRECGVPGGGGEIPRPCPRDDQPDAGRGGCPGDADPAHPDRGDLRPGLQRRDVPREQHRQGIAEAGGRRSSPGR